MLIGSFSSSSSSASSFTLLVECFVLFNCKIVSRPDKTSHHQNDDNNKRKQIKEADIIFYKLSISLLLRSKVMVLAE